MAMSHWLTDKSPCICNNMNVTNGVGGDSLHHSEDSSLNTKVLSKKTQQKCTRLQQKKKNVIHNQTNQLV